jgi:hypothetical protein
MLVISTVIRYLVHRWHVRKRLAMANIEYGLVLGMMLPSAGYSAPPGSV